MPLIHVQADFCGLQCSSTYEDMIGHHSYMLRNLSSCEIKARKKYISLVWDSNQ